MGKCIGSEVLSHFPTKPLRKASNKASNKHIPERVLAELPVGSATVVEYVPYGGGKPIYYYRSTSSGNNICNNEKIPKKAVEREGYKKVEIKGKPLADANPNYNPPEKTDAPVSTDALPKDGEQSTTTAVGSTTSTTEPEYDSYSSKESVAEGMTTDVGSDWTRNAGDIVNVDMNRMSLSRRAFRLAKKTQKVMKFLSDTVYRSLGIFITGDSAAVMNNFLKTTTSAFEDIPTNVEKKFKEMGINDIDAWLAKHEETVAGKRAKEIYESAEAGDNAALAEQKELFIASLVKSQSRYLGKSEADVRKEIEDAYNKLDAKGEKKGLDGISDWMKNNNVQLDREFIIVFASNMRKRMDAQRKKLESTKPMDAVLLRQYTRNCKLMEALIEGKKIVDAEGEKYKSTKQQEEMRSKLFGNDENGNANKYNVETTAVNDTDVGKVETTEDIIEGKKKGKTPTPSFNGGYGGRRAVY